jgi:4-carboxymuconolactone decarboxylase
MLLDPPLGLALQDLGQAIRFLSALSDREREVAVLELAASLRCSFEWYVHEKIGRAFGLRDEEIEALKSGRDAKDLSASEQMIRRVVGSLHHERRLDDHLYSEAERLLGQVLLQDLIVLVGYYELLALSLEVWKTPLPPGADDPFEG